MQDHRLVLYPTDTHAVADPQLLHEVLSETGLLGEEHDWQGAQHYLPGEQFLERITFLGCSPFINLAPPENDAMGSEYCHIGLQPNAEEMQFLGGTTVRVPRCPHCKASLDNWHEIVHSVEPLACTHCQQPVDRLQLNWRRSAAFARSAIHIWGVHDGEAVPSDILLAQLKTVTGCRWAYFYYQSR